MPTNVPGEDGKLLRIAPERDGLFQFWIQRPGSSHNGWLISIRPDQFRPGLVAGTYRGESWKGVDRSMTVATLGNSLSVRIHTPSDSSGLDIVVPADVLQRAMQRELV